MAKVAIVIIGSVVFGIGASVGYIMLTVLNKVPTDWGTATTVAVVVCILGLVVGFFSMDD